MAVGQIAQKKPDPCSFVIFGVTGDLAHRLVVPALYNLAASDLLPDRFCLVGVARKGMTGDSLRDSLLKGLRQFATQSVDDAIAQRLLSCLTCIEADPKDPASFDAMSKQRPRPTRSCRSAANLAAPACWPRTARGGGWWSKSRSAPISLRQGR